MIKMNNFNCYQFQLYLYKLCVKTFSKWSKYEYAIYNQEYSEVEECNKVDICSIYIF